MPPLILKDVIKATNPAGKSIYIVMLKGSNTEVDEICRGKKELKKFKKEFDAFNYIVDHRQDLLNSVPDDTKWNCFCRSRCTCHGM